MCEWGEGLVWGVLPGPAGFPVGTGKGVSVLRLWLGPRSGSWPSLVLFLLFLFVPSFVSVSVSVSISVFVSLSLPVAVLVPVPVSVSLSVSGHSGAAVGGGRAGDGLSAVMGSLVFHDGPLFLSVRRQSVGQVGRCRVRQQWEGFLHL